MRAKDNSIARLRMKGECDVRPEGYAIVCSLGLISKTYRLQHLHCIGLGRGIRELSLAENEIE